MKKIIALIAFILGMALVIIGQGYIGPVGLLTQLVGLSILITLLYFYNKQYQ